MNDYTSVIEALEFLKEDTMTTKKLKDTANQIIILLKEDSDSKVDKALRELEELDSSEIPSYDRTQIWDIVSMLESLTTLTKL